MNVAPDCVKIATGLALTGLGHGMLEILPWPDGTSLGQKALFH